ncbi:hypothetical protein Bca4012_067356 [Brassica carinata]
MPIAECLVGDENGIIIFTARNDHGLKTIHIYSVHILMFLVSNFNILLQF